MSHSSRTYKILTDHWSTLPLGFIIPSRGRVIIRFRS